MTTHTTTDAAVTPRDDSTLALILGILPVPGSVLTWDALPGGGFVWGPIALAVVAIFLGVAVAPAVRDRSRQGASRRS